MEAPALGALAVTPAVAPPVAPLVPASTTDGSLGGSDQKATPAATTALPITWLAPVAPPPPDGPIVVISGRRVRLGAPGAAEQPSLYRLCRQWVQNEPDLGELCDPLPISKLPQLPAQTAEAAAVLQRPAPTESPLTGPSAAAGAGGAAAAAAAAAAAGTDAAVGAAAGGAAGTAAETPAVDALMKHHKQHWAAVRQHMKEQAVAGQQRYAQRLQAYMTSAAGGAVAAAPVPVQQ